MFLHTYFCHEQTLQISELCKFGQNVTKFKIAPELKNASNIKPKQILKCHKLKNAANLMCHFIPVFAHFFHPAFILGF